GPPRSGHAHSWPRALGELAAFPTRRSSDLQLQRELTEAGYRTSRYDFLDRLPPGLGRALRSLYARQLRLAPGSWGWLLGTEAQLDRKSTPLNYSHLGRPYALLRLKKKRRQT